MWEVKFRIEGYLRNTSIFLCQDVKVAVPNSQSVHPILSTVVCGFLNQGFVFNGNTIVNEVEGQLIGGYANSSKFSKICSLVDKTTLDVYAKTI